MTQNQNGVPPAEQSEFITLYETIYEDLYRFAVYTLRSSQDAEDAVSEAVIDAYSSFSRLKDREKFRSWMFRILSVKCKRMMRGYYRQSAELDEKSTIKDSDLAGSTELRAAFARLSGEERLIVSLSVFGGYSSREIGKTLFLNPNTVRSKQSRALAKIKAELEETGTTNEVAK